ncbi:family 16 glycosylhydrolase [Pseudonocardia tropica]|uniref:Family 16 glycosylhydrolase n=1 Tax=Pseudonocardia tropica TaxID=681289 RepID=A0ABV1K0Y9_9PSEU
MFTGGVLALTGGAAVSAAAAPTVPGGVAQAAVPGAPSVLAGPTTTPSGAVAFPTDSALWSSSQTAGGSGAAGAAAAARPAETGTDAVRGAESSGDAGPARPAATGSSGSAGPIPPSAPAGEPADTPGDAPSDPAAEPTTPAAPAGTAADPAPPADVPAAPAETPNGPADKPADTGETPADPAPGPADPAPGRADPAPAPADPAPAPADTAPAPADPGTRPAAPEKPADPEEKPVDPADTPVETPSDPAAAPAAPADPSARPADQSAPRAGAASAAERYGWGTPLPASDEFDYTGPPDPAKWNQAGECWPGHAGNGGRCASRSTVKDGKLVQTGLRNGDSAWISSKFNQQYGRWEARVRSEATGPDNGRQYHPLLIIWPQSDRWPQDGEYDFLENGAPGEQCAEAFIHYPHGRGAVQQEYAREKDCGAPLSEWHNVAVEWTPDHVKGFIDGKEWFSFSGGARPGRKNIQDMPSGHLTIQLDNFFGGNMQPARYEVDWVRIYSLGGK